MKLKSRIYKKISRFFNSDKMDTKQELEISDVETIKETPKLQVDYASTSEGRVMMAFRDTIRATPIEKLHWQNEDNKEKACIKHVEGLFSLNKDGKHWKLEILLNPNSAYSRKLTSDEYVELIYKDLHERVEEYIINFLKRKTEINDKMN